MRPGDHAATISPGQASPATTSTRQSGRLCGSITANAVGGDDNISDGYHAEEFLLWGQALKDVGPGERPASDYDLNGPRKNPDRRAQYLKVAVDGIIANLTAVSDAWAPGADYRVGFEGDPKTVCESACREVLAVLHDSLSQLTRD